MAGLELPPVFVFGVPVHILNLVRIYTNFLNLVLSKVDLQLNRLNPMLLHAMHQFDDRCRQIEDIMHCSRACRACGHRIPASAGGQVNEHVTRKLLASSS